MFVCLLSCILGFYLNLSLFPTCGQCAIFLGHTCPQIGILQMCDDEVPSMGHFLLFFPAESSCGLFLSISTKAARMQQPKHQVTYKSLMDELFCLTGWLQGAGELHIRSSPGRAIDALYARSSPQGNYALNWEFPPLLSVLLDSFLHHALFPDFLRG